MKKDFIFMTKLFVIILMIAAPAYFYRVFVIDPQLDAHYAEIYGLDEEGEEW